MVRRRRAGDRMTPLGHERFAQEVQDLLVDAKVPRASATVSRWLKTTPESSGWQA